MTTYARIVDGRAYDCQTASSPAELAKRYHPQWLAANPFTVVPDGTLHGAVDNGNGTFTNPPIVQTYVDRVLLRKEARDHVVQALGGSGSGSALLQYYFDVADASTATTVAARNMRLARRIIEVDTSFSKQEADQLLTALQFTASDRNAVISTWPVVQVF